MNLDFLTDYNGVNCGGAKESSKEPVKEPVKEKSWWEVDAKKAGQLDKILHELDKEYDKQLDKSKESDKVIPTDEEIYDAYKTALIQVLYSFAEPLREKDQSVLPYAPTVDKKTGVWKTDYSKVFNWSNLVLEELKDILEQYGFTIPSDSDINKLLNKIDFKLTGNRSYELRYSTVLQLYDYYLHEFSQFSNSKDLKAIISALTASDKQGDEVLLNSIKSYQILETKRPEEVNNEPTVKELISESSIPKRTGKSIGGNICGGNTVLEIQNQMSEMPIPLVSGTNPDLIKFETPNISLLHARQKADIHKLKFYEKNKGDIKKSMLKEEKIMKLRKSHPSNKDKIFKNKINRIDAVKKLKEIQRINQGY